MSVVRAAGSPTAPRLAPPPARIPADRSKLALLLEKSAQDPRIRTAAASALVASGAVAAAKVVREHGVERRREKQETYRLEAGESPHEGVGRIARGQLDLALDSLDRASGEDDGGEAVHEARKALKQLRALLRLSRGPISKQRYRHENVVFRDAGRALSATRDTRVLLDTLDSLTERYSEGLREGLWSRLRGSLFEAAEQSSRLEPNHARDLIGILSDARARVDTWPLLDDGGQEAFAGGFARVYRRGRRVYRTATSDQNSDTLHELRKRAKDLWHAARLLERVCPERMKALKRDAHRVSELLGEDHDLTILREHAARHSELLTAAEMELLVAVITQRQDSLRREGLTCASELYRQKPRRMLHEIKLA